MKYKCLQIGRDYNGTVSGIHHGTCKEGCPNQCTNEWKYWNDGWHVDISIKISCGKIKRFDMIFFYMISS